MPNFSRFDDFVLIRPKNNKAQRQIAPQYSPGTVTDTFGDAKSDIPFILDLIPAAAGLPHLPQFRSFARCPIGWAMNQSLPPGKVPVKSARSG